jgi:hypothetical protein
MTGIGPDRLLKQRCALRKPDFYSGLLSQAASMQ